jgi:hypothetical protein
MSLIALQEGMLKAGADLEKFQTNQLPQLEAER